jgi:hypothetical protein
MINPLDGFVEGRWGASFRISGLGSIHRQRQEAEQPVSPLDIACGEDDAGKDQRRDERSDPKEKMQTVHERPDLVTVDPGQQGIAAHIQRSLHCSQEKQDSHQIPQGSHHRHKCRGKRDTEHHDCLDAVSGETVVGPPAKLRTDHITQRTGDKDRAEQIERAGRMLCQPGKCRSADGGRCAQRDECEIVCQSGSQWFDADVGGCGQS